MGQFEPSALFDQLRYNIDNEQLSFVNISTVKRGDFVNHRKRFACIIHHVGKCEQGVFLKIPHPEKNYWQWVSPNLLEIRPPATLPAPTEKPERQADYGLTLRKGATQKSDQA